jgi:GTP-binding protein
LRIERAEYVRSAHIPQDFIRDGRPEVAFAGRSNVGKSSLLNRLLGRKALARTGSTPGRTRAVNYFLINGRFWFVDLPGYGYAKAGWEARRGWARLVDEYLRQATVEPARTRTVLLVDAKVGATDLDVQAAGYLRGLGMPVTAVATKIDRLPRGSRRTALAEIGRALGQGETMEVLPISARSGEGVPELWRAIGAHLAAGARVLP